MCVCLIGVSEYYQYLMCRFDLPTGPFHVSKWVPPCAELIIDVRSRRLTREMISRRVVMMVVGKEVFMFRVRVYVDLHRHVYYIITSPRGSRGDISDFVLFFSAQIFVVEVPVTRPNVWCSTVSFDQ